MGAPCSTCARENPTGARFCAGCGAGLPRICPACSAPATADASFCCACGGPLDAAPPPARATAEPPEERRTVTVLFADLAGYTALSERLDPESVQQIGDRALRRLAAEVVAHGGVIDKYIGDNVMARWGAPLAHEDDPERAVRCGLAMQSAMAEVNAEVGSAYGVDLELRVGVNTGEALAGRVGDTYTVSGDAVNTAQRLQSEARAGSVTVGERTFRASGRAIEFRELGPIVLKGKSEPVGAWEAVAVLSQAPPPRREAPLVGRADELSLLDTVVRRAVGEDRAQLVTIVGEPGVGKSRLLREVRARLDGTTVLEGRCPAYGASVVYWALGEILRAECAIEDSDPPDVAEAKLVRTLGGHLAQTESNPEAGARKVALIGRLLGIGDGNAAERDDPERAREAFFSAVLACIQAMASRRPLVLAFEDIHWADEGMLDLIEHLARWTRAPVLLLCLARPELLTERPAWGSARLGATTIALEPLREDEVRELVSALLAKGGDAGLAPLVATRSGGNPLFAEEMVQRLQEEGSADASELPDTVHGLLAARLDALSPFERRLAQHAAVMGRSFWRAALEDVARTEGGDLDAGLAELVARDLVVAEPSGAGERELAFKHVLIRDVAYATLPMAVRARRHRHVAEFIERRAGERVEEVVALLAEHHGRAAVLATEAHLDASEADPLRAGAAHWLEAAGDATAALYSNQEAFAHYDQARRHARDDQARSRVGEKAADVALRLGRVDQAVSLWAETLAHHSESGDPEPLARVHRKTGAALWHKGERGQAIQHYQAGINLLKDGSRSLELVRLYGEAASLYMQTGDNMLAIYAAEKALRLAEDLGETRAASRAHGIFGRVFGRMGDAEKARTSLERSLSLARDLDRAETILSLTALANHLEVVEADYAGAEDVYLEAMAIAEEMGDVPARVELHAALAQLAVYAGDWERVTRYSNESARLSEGEGLTGKMCLPLTLRGLLAWRAGDLGEAERRFAEAHELATRVGWSEVAWAALFGLAQVHNTRGDLPAAAIALQASQQVAERAALSAQQVQTQALLAQVHAAAGDQETAMAAAARAGELATRFPSPVGRAAAREADGLTTAGSDGMRLLDEARSLWEELGRPLDAARCALLAGESGADPLRLEQAAATYDRLGVDHLAARARAHSLP